ncbi:MAG: thiamine-phosphate kinase [Alphaproteobacteria bacterium]|nr:thiamine-phosphate kinase [Alphaproteobacteria bacterium]
MTPSGKAEDRFIQRYFGPLANNSEALGLHDDAAQIAVPDGKSLVVSTDTLVAGIHFFHNDPPASLARKALRVNVSDLVAKGSTPKGYFLSLALPEAQLRSQDWMSDFAVALGQDQKALGLQIMGGDTVMTKDVSAITICAFGWVPQGQMVKRSGAGVGDLLYVTGTIGDSAIGLWARRANLFGLDELTGFEQQLLACLTEQERTQLELSYLEPPTNLPAADIVLNFASSSMDISDGLSGDAATLSGASNVGMEINMADIPHHAILAPHLENEGVRARLITGGDDYQILCTVTSVRSKDFEIEMAKAKVAVTCIGKIVEQTGVRFLDGQQQELSVGANGFDHFSD